MIPDEKAAEAWWVRSRWPHGVVCPACGSMRIQHRKTRKPQPYRCRDCRKDFSAKTGSLLEGSPLPFQTWVIAIYILTTGIKGTSSMKLHRDLRITQKSTWFLAHRIRETWAENCGAPFTGPVEADETLHRRQGPEHAPEEAAAARARPGEQDDGGWSPRPTDPEDPGAQWSSGRTPRRCQAS